MSKMKKILSNSTLTMGVFVLLLLFTVTKISENVVKDWALMVINQALAPQRLSVNSEEFQIGLFPKPNALLKKASIQNTMTGQFFQLEAVKVSPSILSLFTGKIGADIYIPMGTGSFNATLGTSGRNFSITVDGANLELGQIFSLAGFPGIKTKGQLNLELFLSGDMQTAPSWNGELSVTGKNLAILPQNIMGIELPIMSISEMKNKVTLTGGKAKIVDGIIGKIGDDIAILLSGDLTLQNRMDESQVNLKAILKLSQKITSSLTILEAILSQSKQADGSYGYLVTGIAVSPVIAPLSSPLTQ
ncbi:MAG: type II secretion system protein GspN [Xanthomonadaceae bacterium]|nr:type II secretion system protein GspN [Xanthomonadaceae bacterium]